MANEPGQPTFTNVTPTSVTVSWTASIPVGVSIVTYRLRRSLDPWDSPYVDSDALNLTRNVTGLVPGTAYRFRVYALLHPLVGGGANFWSPSSVPSTITLPGAVWIRYGGKWKLAVPYVRDAGKWKTAIAYVRSGGTWHSTS